ITIGIFSLTLCLLSLLITNSTSLQMIIGINVCIIGGFYNILYIVKKSLLTKKLLFKKILKIEFASSVFSICVGIGAAKLNFGSLSLFLFYLSKNITSFFLSSKYIPLQISIRKVSFSELFKSMDHVAGFTLFNFVNYFSRNFDKVIISASFGNATLGQYGLAYRIMTYPIQTISSIVNGAIYPILVSKRDKIKTKYLESIFIISSITFPMMFFISWYSNDILFFLLGDGWEMAAGMLKIMALAGALQSVTSTVGLLYQLSNDIRTMNKIALLNTTLILLVIIIFSYFIKSIDYLVIMYLTVYTLISPHTILIPAKKFNINSIDLIQSILPPLGLSIVLSIIFSYCSVYEIWYYLLIVTLLILYVVLFRRRVISFFSM
ncbi:oligosaccharide flippase family protein, partial [Escherichia coli]|nr:oligosaccharide flippase family protein [Escherichia coli]